MYANIANDTASVNSQRDPLSFFAKRVFITHYNFTTPTNQDKISNTRQGHENPKTQSRQKHAIKTISFLTTPSCCVVLLVCNKREARMCKICVHISIIALHNSQS